MQQVDGSQLFPACEGVVAQLVSHGEPLSDGSHARILAVTFARCFELPDSKTVGELVDGLHDVWDAFVLAAIFGLQPCAQLFLVGTIVVAEGGKTHQVLVVAFWLKSDVPVLGESFHLGGDFLDASLPSSIAVVGFAR